MSDLPYVAIALALNPNLAEEIRKSPQSATESIGLNLSSEELGRLSSVLSSISRPGGMQPPGRSPSPTPSPAARLAKPTYLDSSERHKLELDQSGKQKVVDQVAPLILDSIEASGLNLSASEIDTIKNDIARGLEITIPTIGPLAKVSGNVAGSCTVDW